MLLACKITQRRIKSPINGVLDKFHNANGGQRHDVPSGLNSVFGHIGLELAMAVGDCHRGAIHGGRRCGGKPGSKEWSGNNPNATDEVGEVSGMSRKVFSGKTSATLQTAPLSATTSPTADIAPIAAGPVRLFGRSRYTAGPPVLRLGDQPPTYKKRQGAARFRGWLPVYLES